MAVRTKTAKYVMDSSSWARIDEMSDNNHVWSAIEPLISAGLIVPPVEVWDELEKNTGIINGLRLYREQIVIDMSTEIDYLLRVGRIALDHPAMSGSRLARNRADPYVIAMAEHFGLTVVADETTARRPNRKIPGVCAIRSTPCIDLIQLLRREDPEGGW